MEDITQQCDQELSLLLFNTEFHYNALCSIARRAIDENDMIDCARDYYSDFYHFTDEQEEDVKDDIIELYAEYNPPISDMEEVTQSLINGQFKQAQEQYNDIVLGNGGNEREAVIELLYQVGQDFPEDEFYQTVKKILGV